MPDAAARADVDCVCGLAFCFALFCASLLFSAPTRQPSCRWTEAPRFGGEPMAEGVVKILGFDGEIAAKESADTFWTFSESEALPSMCHFDFKWLALIGLQ